jgi:outer membrane protein TolC
VEKALAQSRERADVRAQRADVEASARRVRYEKGSYWPTLDLLGNYYTHRAPAYLAPINWDVTLALSVPLFQGGRVQADVRRATSAQRQSQLMLEELERRVVYQVRRLHGDLSAAVEESQAQEDSADAAQKSYDSLKEEYKLGLVTNLDVLQALDLLLSQRGARDAARLDVKRLFISLGVATETLP